MKRFILILCAIFICTLSFAQSSEWVAISDDTAESFAYKVDEAYADFDRTGIITENYEIKNSNEILFVEIRQFGQCYSFFLKYNDKAKLALAKEEILSELKKGNYNLNRIIKLTGITELYKYKTDFGENIVTTLKLD